MMTTSPLTIAVDSQAAEAFASAAPEDRRKIELLLGLRLRELTVDSQKPLRQIMDEIGADAQRKGLTAEILSELMNGE
jgi:hypothetical protein